MEDFLGILMFILYIVFSVTRNRKKGMQKDRNRRSPQPIKEVRETRVKEYPRTGRRVPEAPPVMSVPAAPGTAFGDSYPKMIFNNYELSSYESEKTPTEETFEPITDAAPAEAHEVFSPKTSISLDKASILQAVIWNEILQKPKSRRRHA